jgi:hypothetical protein
VGEGQENNFRGKVVHFFCKKEEQQEGLFLLMMESYGRKHHLIAWSK